MTYITYHSLIPGPCVDFVDRLNHLLNFLAPALFLALLLPLAGRWCVRPSRPAPPWWLQTVVHSVLGSAVLLAGLWWLGHDGKMLTYAALVLVAASVQWLCLRAWQQ